ncbi:hypothetical protein AVEN_168795-1 [Araneus ventricosus]|uniref:Uncharacterized protein n=1 Tax=Araneus ventricosus TaxID=182803 RepID=A0A4Y2K8J0_ARAVE|nr:hypothetical protein AVEN_168795-1 [Araneus ventricosus]
MATGLRSLKFCRNKSRNSDGSVFTLLSCKNWPGNRKLDPHTSSAEEALISSLNAVRIPSNIVGTCCTQRSVDPKRHIKKDLRKRSTMPFAAGLYAAVRILEIPKYLVREWKRSLSKFLP